MMGERCNPWYKWDGNVCKISKLRDGRNCARTSGLDRNDSADGVTGKVGSTLHGGTGNSRNSRRWEQRPRSGTGVGKSRSGTKYTRDSRFRPDPFPTRPLPRVPSHFWNSARSLRAEVHLELIWDGVCSGKIPPPLAVVASDKGENTTTVEGVVYC